MLKFSYSEHKIKRDAKYQNNKYRDTDIIHFFSAEYNKKNKIKFLYQNKSKNVTTRISLSLNPNVTKRASIHIDPNMSIDNIIKPNNLSECKICYEEKNRDCDLCENCSEFICKKCSQKCFNFVEKAGNFIKKNSIRCPICFSFKHVTSKLKNAVTQAENVNKNYIIGICKKCAKYDIIFLDCVEPIQQKGIYICDNCSMSGIEYKSCPNCFTKIIKNGGCNHMTCTICKYEWCWICLKNYDDCDGH
jgi:hypothetical protein